MVPTRRRVLAGVVTIGFTAVAGCTGTPGSGRPDTETPSPTPTESPTAVTDEPTANPAPPGVVAGSPTVAVTTHPDLGAHLTDADGRTLYRFTRDADATSTCTGDCATAWPPLLVDTTDDLEPPAGVPGPLGTSERDEGTLQVTYDDHPLYFFQGDDAPGDVTGHGVNDVWFVVAPAPTATPTLDVTTNDVHGDILTDADGMTLYRFTRDEPNESTCYGGCASAWPPLLVEDVPIVPAGLPGAAGTTMRDDGSLQVTYDEEPLYYYAGDQEPGDTTGNNVSEVWFVVEPGGETTAPTIAVETHPEHGAIVTDADGNTLYVFTPDSPGTSTCYGDCADAWPPLTVDGDVVLPDGIPGPVGTTTRDDGTRQVTLRDAPLYHFAGDDAPGDANGHGLNDVWFVAQYTTTDDDDGGGVTY